MSGIWTYWQAGGVLMLPLAALSLFVWYRILLLLFPLRQMLKEGRTLETTLSESDRTTIAESLMRWRRDARLLPALLPQQNFDNTIPDEQIRGHWQGARTSALSSFHRELALLHTLVAAAPLLGLLGTVKGMIAAFLVLAMRANISIDVLSQGISEALVTTQAGLVIAVLGLLGTHSISRLLQRLHTSLERMETRTLLTLRRERLATQGAHG